MKHTTNYNLNKPEANDNYNVEHQNENMDVIDQKLHEVDQAIDNIEVPVTSVNQKTGDVVLTAADVGAATPAQVHAVDQKVDAHLAEKATDTTPPHGMGKAAAQAYETGIWTPVLRGSGTAGINSYAHQLGEYVRIGNLVHFVMRVVLSSKDVAMSGSIQISGLPFASKNGLEGVSIATVSQVTYATGNLQLTGRIITTSRIQFYFTKSGAPEVTMSQGDLTDNSLFYLSGTYKIS